MIEAIPLVGTSFWDLNFLLYPKYILNFVKKLELKTKNLKANIVKKQIRQIWAIKIIAKLDILFINNLDW